MTPAGTEPRAELLTNHTLWRLAHTEDVMLTTTAPLSLFPCLAGGAGSLRLTAVHSANLSWITTGKETPGRSRRAHTSAGFVLQPAVLLAVFPLVTRVRVITLLTLRGLSPTPASDSYTADCRPQSDFIVCFLYLVTLKTVWFKFQSGSANDQETGCWVLINRKEREREGRFRELTPTPSSKRLIPAGLIY